MKRYRVINQPITLYTGILELSQKQAQNRLASLIDLGEGLYEIKSPVQFKVGEVIGYDGDVSKAMLESLADPEAIEPGTESTSQPAINKKGKK